MVQTMILIVTKDVIFDKTMIPSINLFNEYYGGSMGSVVFQEIREAKALAYSAFAVYTTPGKPDKSHYTYAFVATQADKLKIATDAMLELMTNMPVSQESFNLAKQSILKQIETNRITGSDVFWNYQRNLDRGINYDIRKTIYEEVGKADIKVLVDFFNQHLKGKKYCFMVIGDKKSLKLDKLKKIGKFIELSLKDLFNY